MKTFAVCLGVFAVLAAGCDSNEGGGPAPGPDASAANLRIAFVLEKDDGGFPVATLLGDGTQLRELTKTQDIYGHPSWSPDGKKIVFHSQDTLMPDCNKGIFVVNEDGSAPTQVTKGDDLYPSWSPDGKRIAFLRKGGDARGIWTMKPDGSDAKLVSKAAGMAHLSANAWSPDSKKIVFLADEGKGPLLHVMNADGSSKKAIAKGKVDPMSGAFSPCGKKIAFHAFPGEQGGIYVMNADGSDAKRLYKGASACYPAWSPCGKKIAFQQGPALFLVNADGSGATIVTSAGPGCASETPAVWGK